MHCEQREVAVLQPEWIAEVTHFQKSAREVAVGPFLLLPVCCDPVAPEENCGGLRTPETVPLAHPPPLVRESRLETGFGPVVPELVEEEEKEEEEEVRVQEEVGEILDSGVTTVMFDQGGCVLGECSVRYSNSDASSNLLLDTGQVHILQLEPSSALHIDCLEPVHTRIIDFKCNRNGHTVHKRPVSQAH